MLTALAGALIGGGLAVAAAGLRSAPPTMGRETPPRKAPPASHRSRLVQTGMAVAVAVVALAATGWPVVAVLAGCAAAGLPSLSGGRRRRVDQRAVIEAIAAWTEMLRDAVASGRGVQEAVALTAPLAPVALREATLSLRARSVRGPLAPALRAFADEVGDPMADLVAATLTLAATREVRELADLLGALARTTRQRAALRLAAEAGRAGMRTTARAIAGMTIVLLVGMMALQPAYLAPYATPIGQVVALAAAAWFALGFWGLSRLGRAHPSPPVAPARGRDMSGVVLAGALFGLGVLLVGQGFRRRPVTAAADGASGGFDLGDLGSRVGPAALRGATVLRLEPTRRLSADLAIVGRTPEEHAARSVLAAMWLAALVVVVGLGLGTGGVGVAGAWVAGGAVVASLVGPFVATLALKAEAAERRNDLLVDLGAYADLVVLLLAAGSGIEGALTTAADAGDDWTWRRLRDALRGARLTRRTPAEALTELGRTVGVVEIEEFGAAVALASSSGSRLRESLASRSEALRSRELARVQAQAASATERMTFPVVALAVGFLVVLGFPALTRVLAGF